jgi:hypothetical protein
MSCHQHCGTERERANDVARSSDGEWGSEYLADAARDFGSSRRLR